MTDSHHTLDIDGQAVPLRIRRHAAARRLILRMDENTGGAIVTIPKRSAIREALDMAQRKSAWIAAQLKRQLPPIVFAHGAIVPYLGDPHTIHHEPGGRGITRHNDQILVTGRAEHTARRLTDWLKSQARTEISNRAYEKAAQIEHRINAITIRDTRSRWGSCSAQAKLNFSWRLILAPAFVLDYVVAHEVAHLAHHNHGHKFWGLTASLTPQMDEAKAWLNIHGRELHRYG